MMDPYRVARNMEDYYRSRYYQDGYDGGLDFIRQLEVVLDEEFQLATPTETNVDITTVAGTLKFDIYEVTENNVYRMPWIISEGVADYWGRAIETTGIPVSCDNIESVTNDAPKIIDPLAYDLINQVQVGPDSTYYHRFFDIIIKHVRTIIWTVKESDGNCDATFTVYVQ